MSTGTFDFTKFGDLQNAETEFPVLMAGLVPVEVSKVEVTDNRAKDGQNLKITMKTTQPQQTIKNKTQNPGLPITVYVGLKETEKRTADNISSDLANLMKCFTGTQAGTFNPESLIGQQGTLNMKVTGDVSDEYGIQNQVAKYVHKD